MQLSNLVPWVDRPSFTGLPAQLRAPEREITGQPLKVFLPFCSYRGRILITNSKRREYLLLLFPTLSLLGHHAYSIRPFYGGGVSGDGAYPFLT
jgi:hypothetical protein